MARRRETTATLPEVRDWPAYWMVRLDEAVRGSDFAAAAEAQTELRRLGIEVRYAPTGKAVPHGR